MAVTISFYNKFPEYFGDGTIDLDTDTFAIMLMNSSHVFTATHTLQSEVTANQLATAFGYTQAAGGGTGELLTGVTWTEAAGVVTWNATDVTWTANGGSIAADDAVIFDDTATVVVDALVCSVDFGGTTTAGDGTQFVITWNVNGIFTLT